MSDLRHQQGALGSVQSGTTYPLPTSMRGTNATEGDTPMRVIGATGGTTTEKYPGASMLALDAGAEVGLRLLEAIRGAGDGKSDNYTQLIEAAYSHSFNGGSWDRQRNNTEGVLLASAARTASTDSAVQTNHNARGILLTLDVTAVSGTGGLTVRVHSVDPVTGKQTTVMLANAARTAVQTVSYLLYPGAATAQGDLVQVNSVALPRKFVVRVSHGDGSSYTYSLGFALIL